MSEITKNTAGRFQAETAAAVAAIDAQIAETEAAIEAIGAELAQVYLRRFTAEPLEGDEAVEQRHKDLVEQLHRLRLARAAADAAEQERVAKQRYQADGARHRAFAQKTGAAVRRELDKAASAMDVAYSAYVRACAAARDATALLPPGPMRAHGGPGRSILNPRWIARLFRAELVRLQRLASTSPEEWIIKEGTLEFMQAQGWQTPMVELVSQDIEGLKAQAAKFAMPDPAEPPKPEAPIVAPEPVDTVVNLSSVAYEPAAEPKPETEDAA